MTPTRNLVFVSGLSAESWFQETTGKFGDPQGGLDNIRGADGGPDGTYSSFRLPNVLGAPEIINTAVQLFSGAAPAAPANGDGTLDYGILEGGTGVGGSPDVGFVGDGAVHASVILNVAGDGADLEIAMGPNDGIVVASGDGILTPVVISVPEPATASLGTRGLRFDLRGGGDSSARTRIATPTLRVGGVRIETARSAHRPFERMQSTPRDSIPGRCAFERPGFGTLQLQPSHPTKRIAPPRRPS